MMRLVALVLALLAGLVAPASAQIITYAPPLAITADGTAAAPSHSYTADPDLGSYRIGANNEGFTAGGVLRWDYNTTRILSTIPFYATAGGAAAPAYSFSGTTTVGMDLVSSTVSLVGNTIRFYSDTNDFFGATLGIGTGQTAATRISLFNEGGSNATTGTQYALRLASALFNPGSGTPIDVIVDVSGEINWGGTPGAGSYEALRIVATETAIPTGTNWMWRALAGAAGATFRGGLTNAPWYVAAEATTDPGTGLLSSLDTFAIYMKSNKLVIAYNNAGTITYMSLAMDGSATTWVHNTTAP